ncbi:MAG: DUF2141 domain-containing protein [Myxococcaceae bacterium]|jgi:uncharacterized protein (DUF2141 family)|nr:DUF2141 domain-containing protein [Myxococcaceae bacterium]MCA3012878.1 DUF2141 domain-containing protein [Myxococcaceae bacterium]
MTLSRPARLMSGLTLLTVPTIVYGGLTVLAVVTGNAHGLAPAAGLALTPLQQSLFRAGHAHAGALVILSLVLQVLLDATTLREPSRWVARVTAPAGAVLLSGGFFGLAFAPGFAALLWLGAACLVVTVVLTGAGLVRAPSVASAGARAPVSAAVAAALLVASGAGAAEPGRLEVVVSGVSAAKGLVGCALFSSKAGFPLDSKKHAAAQVRVAPAGGSATCVFENVAPGEYAVAVVHDTNDNGQADTNFLGMPTEGVGVSNNALPRMSSPSFEACRFPVSAGQTTKQAITLRY